MRWFDLFTGLMATTMGFGAVVGWRAGMPTEAIGGFVAAAIGFLILMAWGAAHAEQVLVVGAPSADPSLDVRGNLDDVGFAVRTCVGPASRPCPVFDGRECPISGHPVAAVVRVPRGYAGPAAPCGSVFRIPMLEIREEADGAFAMETFTERTPTGPPNDVIAAMDRALSAAR